RLVRHTFTGTHHSGASNRRAPTGQHHGRARRCHTRSRPSQQSVLSTNIACQQKRLEPFTLALQAPHSATSRIVESHVGSFQAQAMDQPSQQHRLRAFASGKVHTHTFPTQSGGNNHRV